MSRFAGQTRGLTVQGSLPYITAALCVLLHSIPLGMAFLPQLSLGLFFVPLFIIGLYADGDRAPIFFALIGLMADVLTEAPLGYWAFLTIICYILSSGQKQVLQNATFSSHWLSFIIVVFVIYLLGFTISLMLTDMDVNLGAQIVSAIITGLSYPVIALPLKMIMTGASYEGV